MKWYNRNIDKWFAMPLKERNKFKRGVFIFHSISFWILLALLSPIHPFFMWVLIGVAIHMTIDFPHSIYYKEPLWNKILLYKVIIRNKNKKDLIEL